MAIIAIDFDHTIVEGEGANHWAREAINVLREAGHKIMIHSCNNSGWIRKTLNNNDIRYDSIWEGVGKPICDLYIDDKGYRYIGNWETELPTILKLIEGMDNRKW